MSMSTISKRIIRESSHALNLIKLLCRSCGLTIIPRGCAGCDIPDIALCPSCIRDFSRVLVRKLPCVTMRCCFAASAYRKSVRLAILAWKDHGDEELTDCFGDIIRQLTQRTVIPWLKQHPRISSQVICVVPVPSSPASLHKRGRLHTKDLANSVVQQLRSSGFDAVTANCLRIKHGAVKSVQTAGIRGRLQRSEGLVYLRRPQRLFQRYVILVDDIVTSASTVRQCAQVVAQSQAYPLTALLLASAVKG